MAVSSGHSHGSQKPPPGNRTRKRATQVWKSKLQLVTTVLSLLWVRDASGTLMKALDHLPDNYPGHLRIYLAFSFRGTLRPGGLQALQRAFPSQGSPQGFSAPAGASVRSLLGDCGRCPATTHRGCTYGIPFWAEGPAWRLALALFLAGTKLWA